MAPASALPCARPVVLPADAPISDRQVEILWGRDRNELVNCAAKLDVLAGRVPPPK